MTTRQKRTTTTTKITEALHAPGVDFMDLKMLMAATHEPVNRVTAALHHLRKKRVVDVVVNADGAGWWFALPPEFDQRSIVHEEIVDGITHPAIRRKRKGLPQ